MKLVKKWKKFGIDGIVCIVGMLFNVWCCCFLLCLDGLVFFWELEYKYEDIFFVVFVGFNYGMIVYLEKSVKFIEVFVVSYGFGKFVFDVLKVILFVKYEDMVKCFCIVDVVNFEKLIGKCKVCY